MEEILVFHLTFYFLFLIISIRRRTKINMGMGFIGGPITREEDPEGQSDYNSSYHSAETEIISDSEDHLFFLDGELATTYYCK